MSEIDIPLIARMLAVLRTLQEIGGVSDKELLEVAIDAGASFDDIEADYLRYLAVYGPLSPPKTQAEWETLIRRMQEMKGSGPALYSCSTPRV